jgi:thioredoxin reductase (NADPH)
MIFDCIIIGAGPTGISCSINLFRRKVNTLVLYKDLGSLSKAPKIENYYGVSAISGTELALKGIEQLDYFKIPHYNETVYEINDNTNYFEVITNNNKYQGKTILLSTGAARNPLSIKGAKELDGKGLSYCVKCDGFFYRNKKVGIIGNTDYMFHELKYLEELTDDIIIFTDSKELTRDTKYQVVKDKLISIDGADYVESITTEKDNYILDGLFVALDFPNALAFAKNMGISANATFINIDKNYMTNIKGIFAGGDSTGGLLQVSKAAYDGLLISDSIKNYLKELNSK